MNINVIENGIWYHGSNVSFDVLKEGSSITQWRALAEAFSHKPTELSYDDNGEITHNGTEKGYLYVIDEEIAVGRDVDNHPKTSMDQNAEFITKRPLRVKLVSLL